ncbi:unnamed protein product [Clavelina lepadiformis]|uniref:Uncharacterized protein n=1 Tax=Clavelina lepadiformis TaxID=159417 RepID=A0ABP0F4E9_CLALP
MNQFALTLLFLLLYVVYEAECQGYLSRYCPRQLDQVAEGRRCRKPCKKNRDCRGRKKRCRCDGVCGLSCFNPLAACPTLPDIANGTITYSHQTKRWRTTARYQCDEGFTIRGVDLRTCQSDKKWSGEAPICISLNRCGQSLNFGGVREQVAILTRVVGGIDAEEGAWPWQAVLVFGHSDAYSSFQTGLKGGGSLISEHWVLTAAHVIAELETYEDYLEDTVIALGFNELPNQELPFTRKAKLFRPRFIIKHPKYEIAGLFDFDIALVRLGKEITIDSRNRFAALNGGADGEVEFTNFIRPVCLPCSGTCITPNLLVDEDGTSLLRGDETPEEACRIEGEWLSGRKSSSDNVEAIVTGFGSTRQRSGNSYSFATPALTLQQGVLKFQNDDECKSALSKINRLQAEAFPGFNVEILFTPQMLCARSGMLDEDVDACQGDSGGSVVREIVNSSPGDRCWVQLGVVSFGYGCAYRVGDYTYPGYYADVSTVFHWIQRCRNRLVNEPANTTLTCIEAATCRVLSIPPGVDSRSTSLPLLEEGIEVEAYEILHFSCIDELATLQGRASVTCLLDGTFSHPYPTGCVRLCTVPPYPSDVSAVIANGTEALANTKFFPPTEIRFSCLNDEEFIRGNTAITCQTNGSWSGDVPTGCVRVCTIPSFPNGVAAATSHQGLILSNLQVDEGTTVQFSCLNDRATLQGNNVLLCQDDGTWNGSLPTACDLPRIRFCYGSGDPHYTSFDGKRFDFQGTCSYILVQNSTNTPTPFQVEVDNEHRGGNSRVAWLRKAMVYIGNTPPIELTKGPTVKVGPGTVNLPYVKAVHGVEIRRNGRFVRIETSIGLVVDYDGNSYIAVGLPEQYMNRVNGLCGNNNEDSSDDFENLENGEIYPDNQVASFGNQFQTPTKQECQVLSDEENNIECPQRESFADRCHILIDEDGCFAKCHQVFDPQPSYDDCVFDACAYNDPQASLENNVGSYAKKCQDFGVVICPTWRQETNTEITCPPNSAYSNCMSRCPATCAESTCTDRTCVEGCECNEGYVLSGDECVLKSECGCTRGARYYKSRESYYDKDCSRKCTCESGTINCEEFSCGEGEECGRDARGIRSCIPAGFGTCIAWGDPHYMTFDGSGWFDFMGICEYYMARTHRIPDADPSWFSIKASNEHRGSNTRVSYLRNVTVGFFGGEVVFDLEKNGVIKFNDEVIQSYASDQVTISPSGRTILLKTVYGLTVKFDGSRLQITLPSTYMKKVQGLCGNYSNLREDDLETMSGVVTNDFNVFAQSYIVGNCSTPDLPEPFVCSDENQQRWGSDEACGALTKDDGVLASCHGTVDVQSFFEKCVFDVCATDGDQFTLSQALETYAAECQSKGVKLCNWRNNNPTENIQCPSHSHYDGCASPCPDTCPSPFASANCAIPGYVEDCVCDVGYVRDQNICIRKTECGMTENGVYVSQSGGEKELQKLWARTTVLNREVSSIFSGWHNYRYDHAGKAGHTGNEVTSIGDGGDDMYDTGNMVKFYEGKAEPTSPLAYNKLHTFPSFSVRLGGSIYPFLALSWISNPSGESKTYTLQVSGEAGADGNGNIDTASGRIIEFGANLKYHMFQLNNAGNDPTICEVYFVIEHEEWESVLDGDFNILRFSNGTEVLNNAVRLEGIAQDVAMGYALLSVTQGARIPVEKVEYFLRRLVQHLLEIDVPLTTTPVPVSTTPEVSSAEVPVLPCPADSWTQWFDVDDPTGNCDCEHFEFLQERFSNPACSSPINFEARTVGSHVPYDPNQPNIRAGLGFGFTCFNQPNVSCDDYEIRYCCPSGGNISLGLLWNRTSLLSNDITSVIPRWYNYVYDDVRSPQITIVDGGNDMYDNGNLVRFYEDNAVPENPLPYNSELIGSTFQLQVGGTTHPFMMLAWITNKNRTRHSYTIDVRSATGADGGGSIAIYNGTLTEESVTVEYHSFQIHGASDPSICEVYFTMYSQAKWGSIPGDSFDVVAFSDVTDPTANSVTLSGTPSNVLMGYMLLSRISGGLIHGSEVQRTLISLMQRLQGQASNLEELKSEVVKQTLDAIKRSNLDLTTSYPNWYNYTYDGGVNFINDGGNDMFDGANRISIYEDGLLDIADVLYNQLYKSFNFEFQSSAGEPFLSILWVFNDNNRPLNITLQVTGNPGADGSGVITNSSGNLTSGDYRMSYHVFEIHGATDPTICEVYFAVHNTALWNSTPAAFTVSRFTTSTQILDNSVQLVGNPRNVMMGYTLLSKFPTALISKSEVEVVLDRILETITTIDVDLDDIPQ